MRVRTPSTSRRAAYIAAIAVLGIALTGCGSVSEAIDTGQQALDSASEAVEAADGLIQAGTDIAAACVAAQAAWVPGVSGDDARRALDDATGILDEALAQNPDLPGARELDQALASAQDALATDGTSLGVSGQTLQSLCALATLGG